MDSKFNHYKKILNRYERKAERLRQSHADLSMRYKNYNDAVTLTTIGISATIAFLSLADINKMISIFNFHINSDKANAIFSFLLAILGFIIFICSLLNFILGWQEKYSRHESGVKLLTALINTAKDVDDLLENDVLNEVQIASKIEEIRERYVSICEILPSISDQDFLDSKKKYILKRRLSEQLDTDPFIDVNLNNYNDIPKRPNNK